MSVPQSARSIHIRALNHLSRDHLLTYLGSRVLAESLHPAIIDEWTRTYIVRKAHTDRRQVYWKHSLFKGFDHNGKHDYRKCVVGSPTTHLTETWLLHRLSQEQRFNLPDFVYSNELTDSNNNHIFKYYYNRYKTRDRDIARAVAAIEDPRVLVFDIRQFYPSVDVSRVKARFTARLADTRLNETERSTALQCVEELTSIKNEIGLPIGPPLSHTLANVFLENFDSILSKEFPGRYFRYVDDVAIVVRAAEAHKVEAFFKSVAMDEGLESHSGKTAHITSHEWTDRLDRRNKFGGSEFGRILNDLKVYFAHRPQDFEMVKGIFLSGGFSFPFSRLRSTATSSRSFRTYVSDVYGDENGERVLHPSEILDWALIQREELLGRVYELLDDKSLSSKTLSGQWAIRDLRNMFNRALYLFPDSMRKEILGHIPDFPELRPTKTVFRALVSGDATPLTKYPGPTVAAFCELWTESRTDKPTIDWSASPIRQERDSVGVMALYGLCTPPAEWIAGLQEDSSQAMVQLAARQFPKERRFDDFSYIDELQSLFLKPDIDFDVLLTTKFDNGEDIVLSTLNLGGEAYLS